MQLIGKENWNQYYDSLKDRHLGMSDLEIDVQKIINEVKINGDEALKKYTKRWDYVALESFKVSDEEIEDALKKVDKDVYEALKGAKDNIEAFHNLQKRSSQFIESEGRCVGEIISPLESVGIYVPGGKASYPSTVLMNAIPALIAGVKRVVMVTPPEKDGSVKPSVLAAASISGVTEIYKVGGAQSIAALAYGTRSIKSVKKIVGPGNIFVATAKKLVSDIVGIDMIAGPSEVLILADDSSNPNFIAADMIAQAEHDERAAAMVITTCSSLVEDIKQALLSQVKTSPRNEIVQKALDDYGAIIVAETLPDMIKMANQIAPEHLEIMVKNPDEIVYDLTSAGAIFVGAYSPEALGDYYAGPNHTLPTGGTAKFSSPLGVDDFIKKTSYIKYNKEQLGKVKNNIMTIANDEGLYGHGNSIRIRFEEA